jgi:hypothetical protein
MITSPDDVDPTISAGTPPQPTPRSSIPGSVDLLQAQRNIPVPRLDAVMGLENFRFCSVLGRGHFGKVSLFGF